MFKNNEARFAALESQVRDLTHALNMEREAEHCQYLQIRGLLDFQNTLLAHLGLRLETVPEARRLVKR